MMKFISMLVVLLCATLVHGAYVEIDNSTVGVVGSSPAFDGTFSANLAIDTGAGFELSDYASLGQGVNTYLDFDFGQEITFNRIIYADRVTSGAAQGSFSGGTADFVTGYNYIFSQNSIFGDGDDVTVSISSLVAPVGPTGVSDFTTSTEIADVSARYVRWDVTSVNSGLNNGASNFEFYSVPEPASALLIFVGGALVALKRRYFSKV